MSLEYVCTEDMEVKFTNTGGPPDLVYTVDPGVDLIKVVPTYSSLCKWKNKRIVTESISITWTVATGGCPHTSLTHTFVSGAAFIQASAARTRAQSKYVLRKGDTALAGCIGSWTNNSSGAAVSCACNVEISEPGQDGMKAQ